MKQFLLIIYSTLMIPLSRLITFLGKLNPKVKAQCTDRYLSSERLLAISKQRAMYHQCKVFFVSSAGEYEQARPLIERLERCTPGLQVVIMFFSESGMRFARSQGESRLFLKAPWDDAWAWNKIFKALMPNETFIARYELWPAFLYFARTYGPVYLFDAVPPSGSENFLTRILKKSLLQSLDRIFFVSTEAVAAYKSRYDLSDSLLMCTGDTKYDRVRERVQERQELLAQISEELSQKWPRKKRFILGSAWQKDWEIFNVAYSAGFGDEWQFILAPHDVSPGMVQWFAGRLENAGISFCKLSSMDQLSAEHQCLLVDKIGVLPELYGCADVAMVGGAMHHRVHNVLEPSVRGLFLCFGPLHKTSQEAIELVREGLAKVVTDSSDLESWWRGLLVEPGTKHQDLVRKIDRMCGASDRIVASVGGFGAMSPV